MQTLGVVSLKSCTGQKKKKKKRFCLLYKETSGGGNDQMFSRITNVSAPSASAFISKHKSSSQVSGTETNASENKRLMLNRSRGTLHIRNS